jgi:DNA-directed RNA polymerase subunit RPC12/RpoP
MKSELSHINDEIENIKDTMPISSNNLDYLNVDLSALPLGIFYKPGFSIKIRAAKVQEVQAYSVVDDKNLIDVTEKMNQMLSACVRVDLPNGLKGSYKDIKDGDRLQLVFMIRELTFQSGNSLAKDITCEYCSHEFKIPFRATANATNQKTFTEHEFPEELKKFFNENERVFEFNIDGVIFKLAPPTIGLQETIYKHIEEVVKDKKTPNVSYLKIIPFLLHDRITITKKGITAKEDEFKRFDMNTFQILNHAVDKMVFGLKGLKMKCPECGQEVHTDMTFPNGASSLFVISDPFDYFN